MSSSAAVALWPEDETSTFGAMFDAAALAGSDVQAHVEWQHDPIGWAEEKLAIDRKTLIWSLNKGYSDHVWDGTPDPMKAIADALVASEDCAVESATGTGKSFFAAVILLWFIACWEGAAVFSFAPKEDQLRLYIWMELRKLWPRFRVHFPTAVLNDLELLIRGSGQRDWGAWGYAVGVKAGEESATGAQGMHRPHMMLIYEETPGIRMPVIVAGENTCTAPHNIRLFLGNPDNQQDALHQVASSPGVTPIRISGLDHPNVVTGKDLIPGAVSRKSIFRREKKYGADHRLFQSRARGISPTEASDALIKSVWVRACQKQYNDLKFRVGAPAWGVDVANSEGGDKDGVARGLGACLLEVTSKPCPDANILGAHIVTEMKATEGGNQRRIAFDAGGPGAGAVNEAKRLGYPRVHALYFGAKAWPTMDEDEDVETGQRRVTNAEKFRNLRAQMYWQFAMDAKHRRIALPPDPELERDLIAVTWFTKDGVIQMESKEEVRERLGRSTNKGDAAVMWNWIRVRRRKKAEEEDASAFEPALLEGDREVKYKLGPRLEKKRRIDKLRIREGEY